MVGRQRELAVLEAALDDLAAGRGAVLLVTGEPGIGKTRIADELTRRATARSIACHWGRAWEAGGAPSYWPFTQVLRGIVRRLAPESATALLGEHAEQLASVVPELRRRDAGQAPHDRFAVFDAVASFVRAVADPAPLVIVLDDLHAADPSTLQLLHFLVRDVRASRVLVLGTYRDAEARLHADGGKTLAAIAREATLMPLRRLDEHEVGELVAETTGDVVSAERVATIFRRTEGNPLFLRELLRLHNSANQPDGIREVVRVRLALVAPPSLAVLEAAAVLGREFWLDPLATVARIAEPELRGLLAPAADAGIVEPLDTAGAWRFTHVLLREGVYDALLPERRSALHAAAVAELRGRVGEPLAELAHHAVHAIPAIPVDEAADVAIAAAARAVDRLAFEDAVALLTRTLARVDQEHGSPRTRCDVMLALGSAQIRANEIELGKATCLHAAELARSLGDGERFARAALAFVYEFTPGVRDATAIALLEEALASLPGGDSALRARCIAQLAAERQPEPDTQPPIALARSAVEMARRLGDAGTLRFTLASAGMAMLVFGDVDERLRINEEALRLALAAGDKRLALRAHLFLGNDHAEIGDVAASTTHLRALAQIADELRHPAFRWHSSLLPAAIDLMTGRFADAVAGFARAKAMMDADQARGSSLAMLEVAVARATERYDDVPGIEAELRARFGAMGSDVASCVGEMAIAQLHGRVGDIGHTRVQLDRVRSHPVFERVTEPAWLALLAEPVHLLAHTELATRLYATLAPRAHRFFNLGPLGLAWEPPYTRQLGLLAYTLGRFDDAIDHLRDAVARSEAIGMRAHLARLRLELVRALLARGKPGDREAAGELTEQARALADELGQRDLLAVLPAPTAASPAPSLPHPHFSLRREGDYWTVTAGGRTARFRDSRGLQQLDQLIAHPGQEFHVLQLVSPTGDDERDEGDAGPVLDSEAVRAYRRRLLDLREQLEDAEQRADAGRAERARDEIEVLTHELARAVGLGGRERRSGGAAERARTTVQKRLRAAIQRISAELPELGRHLDQTIRTGAFCGYLPDGRRRL